MLIDEPVSTAALLSKKVSLGCDSCGQDFTCLVTRCDCGGMAETRYQSGGLVDRVAAGASLGAEPSFFEKFWPVLPLQSMDGIPAGLSLASPTLRADRLRSVIGGPELWLKDEGKLPTRSTKARVGMLLFPFLGQYGIKEFVVSSTGNTSTAVAWMARYYPDMRVHIFVGRGFAPRLRHVASDNVTIHVTQGSFVAAGRAAQQFAARHGLFWEAGFFNPARRDALKTAFIEATMAIGQPPKAYVQAVSSAMGVVGTAKGAGELPAFGFPATRPRLICVQQASCAPMVTAWQARRRYVCKTRSPTRPESRRPSCEETLRAPIRSSIGLSATRAAPSRRSRSARSAGRKRC